MLAPSNVVRVDLGRLDELMRLIGELVTSRARLDESLKHEEAPCPAEGGVAGDEVGDVGRCATWRKASRGG